MGRTCVAVHKHAMAAPRQHTTPRTKGRKMRLSEALVLRADSQKRIERLRARLALSCVVQEGEQPPENPADLLSELETLISQMETLIRQINETNTTATVASGATITSALARRDMLRLRYSILDSVATKASQPVERYSRTEIRLVPTVDVAAIRRQLEDLAREAREIDTAIQAANWTTDLRE
jgi:hypothetical protein